MFKKPWYEREVNSVAELFFLYCKVKTKKEENKGNLHIFPLMAESTEDLWENLQAHISKQFLHSNKKVTTAAVDTWKKCQRSFWLFFW